VRARADEWLRNTLWLPSVFPWSSPQADKAFFRRMFTPRGPQSPHRHTQREYECYNMHYRSEIRTPAKPISDWRGCFCFISPLRFPYQLICIINRGWRRPSEQLQQWFLQLGFLSYFLMVSHRCFLHCELSSVCSFIWDLFLMHATWSPKDHCHLMLFFGLVTWFSLLSTRRSPNNYQS